MQERQCGQQYALSASFTSEGQVIWLEIEASVQGNLASFPLENVIFWLRIGFQLRIPIVLD